MQRLSYKPYLFLALFLILCLSLPQKTVEKLRLGTVTLISPFWHATDAVKKGCSSLFSRSSRDVKLLDKLRQENLFLKRQIEELTAHLSNESQLVQELEKLRAFPVDKPFFQRRALELVRLLESQSSSMQARVIFRPSTSWNSSLWINVGMKHNEAVGKTVVAKNSPVILGTTLVGVVEEVEWGKSRIRLLTDTLLTPSVRVRRGNALLAKGELKGSGAPLWRAKSRLLKGEGFNYDFADEEGEAREITSDIVRQGDLLVTTGLDGVFPAGLEVAKVTRLYPLRGEASGYTLEAKPCAPSLSALTYVTVLPPI